MDRTTTDLTPEPGALQSENVLSDKCATEILNNFLHFLSHWVVSLSFLFFIFIRFLPPGVFIPVLLQTGFELLMG